jgi:hypothetical protein
MAMDEAKKKRLAPGAGADAPEGAAKKAPKKAPKAPEPAEDEDEELDEPPLDETGYEDVQPEEDDGFGDDEEGGFAGGPEPHKIELAAFLGDATARRMAADMGLRKREHDADPDSWAASLCFLAKEWSPELQRQARGRTALVAARLTGSTANQAARAAAGDVPQKLLAAAAKVLIDAKSAAKVRAEVAPLLGPQLLQCPPAGHRVRTAALVALQLAFGTPLDPRPLASVAHLFMQEAGPEDKRGSWKAFMNELRENVVPWALHGGEPLAK